LQLDICNFFNSIDKPILFQLVQHRLRKALAQNKLTVGEADTLRWLTHLLLRHDAAANSVYRGNPKLLQSVPTHKQLGNAGKYKGLPIGNLTSQFFANVYLNELDQFIKHELKCRHYLRYVDDFILLADSPQLLLHWRERIIDFLQQRLQLQLKDLAEPKPVKSGANFLGYIVYPHYRLVRRRVVGSLHERLNDFQTVHIRGSVKSGYVINLEKDALAQLRAVLASYWGHFQHANSVRLRAAIFRHYPWLALLFDSTLQPRWQPPPHPRISYKSQLRFFRRHYPLADFRVQRGLEQDKFYFDSSRVKMDFRKANSYSESILWVTRVIIREQGHLKNGLKCRVVTRLFIQSGVQLCPSLKK
jgi:hypothetical protein